MQHTEPEFMARVGDTGCLWYLMDSHTSIVDKIDLWCVTLRNQKLC